MASLVDNLRAYYLGLGFTGTLVDQEMKFLASKVGFVVGHSNADNQRILTTDNKVRNPLDPTKVP